jgi:hypothetical protein
MGYYAAGLGAIAWIIKVFPSPKSTTIDDSYSKDWRLWATQARTARCLYVPSKADIPLSGDKVIIQMTDELSRERL